MYFELKFQASQAGSSDIKLIASDVDGTLLNSMQLLTPGVEAAIKAAGRIGVPVSHELIKTMHFSHGTGISSLVLMN